jgi:Brp/Blh family beta-carotene 15,15'-monooxygenase
MSFLPARHGRAVDLLRFSGASRSRSQHDVPLSRSAWRWGPYLALAIAGTASLLAPSAVQLVLWLPLLVGLVVVGMPHGAIDHLVPGRVLGRALTRRGFVSFLAGYVLLAALGVALWLVDPSVAVIALLAVAALHWGQGEVWFLIHGLGRDRPKNGVSYVSIIAARGLLPVLGPIAAHPAAFQRALHGALKPFGAGHLNLAPHGTAEIIAVAVLAGALTAGMVAAWRDGPTGRARDIAELVGLAVFVCVTPPVLAIGAYFVAWHSVRHVARLAALDQPSRSVRELARDAAPCTGVAFAGVIALGILLAVNTSSDAALGGVALAVVFGLTLPHALVVAWMDRRQTIIAPAQTVIAPAQNP